jgi:hypothetical protein
MQPSNNEIVMKLELSGEAFANWDMLDEQIVNRIADLFIADHELALRDRAAEIIDRTITRRVEERLESFLAKPIPATDRFGDPVPGATPKTLGDMIAEAADMALTETVDSYGRPEKRTPYNSSVPRIEYLVKKVASEGIANAVAKAVQQVNAEAKAAVQKQVAAEIAARLAKA